MSYNIGTLPAPRQLVSGYKTLDRYLRVVSTIVWVALQIPLHGVKVFPPFLLISIPAAFASAQFAAHHNVFPVPLNWAIGAAFEWITLGTLAMSGGKMGKRFYMVLGASAVTAVVYITMYASEQYGLLTQVQAVLPNSAIPYLRLLVTIVLILVHSVPLTAVNVLYGFLIHEHLKELNSRIYCKYGCGYFSTSEPAVRGHLGQCPNRPKD